MRLPDGVGATAHPGLSESMRKRKASLFVSTPFRTSLFAAAAATVVWAAHLTGQNAESSRRPHFTDAALRSGTSYYTNNNYTGRKYFQQPMCGGIAAFDYNND